VPTLADCRKTRIARHLDYAILRASRSGYVPSQAKEVLTLRRAALDAILLRGSEPAGHAHTWNTPKDADGSPVKIDYEREPS